MPPNRPIPVDPDWRCWGCLVPMTVTPEDRQRPVRPFYQNVCANCWASLPLEWRMQFSAQFTEVDKGGLGHAEVTREVLQLAELFRPLQGDLRLLLDKLREHLERGEDWSGGA